MFPLDVCMLCMNSIAAQGSLDHQDSDALLAITHSPCSKLACLPCLLAITYRFLPAVISAKPTQQPGYLSVCRATLGPTAQDAIFESQPLE